MFKKISMFAVTALAGIVMLTGCGDEKKSSQKDDDAPSYPNNPRAIVEAVCSIEKASDAKKTLHFYDASFEMRTKDNKQIDFEGLKTVTKMSELCATFHKDPSSKNLLQLLSFMCSEEAVAAGITNAAEAVMMKNQLAEFEKMPEEQLKQVCSNFMQFVPDPDKILSQIAKSFKIVNEKIQDDTAEITVECDNYKLERGEVVKDGKVRALYILKKIDGKWKIIAGQEDLV